MSERVESVEILSQKMSGSVLMEGAHKADQTNKQRL